MFIAIILDASIFGPLGIIHTIREALIVNSTFALPSLAVDRYLSTRYPEDYERSTTPHIAYITLTISSIFAVILAILRFMNILSLSIAALIVAGTLLVSLMVRNYRYPLEYRVPSLITFGTTQYHRGSNPPRYKLKSRVLAIRPRLFDPLELFCKFRTLGSKAEPVVPIFSEK
jgi:amino acid transporter